MFAASILADKHSANVKASWYGESIGHYEGDSLVVDTIGPAPYVDGFQTPHTIQLHVVERWHMTGGAQILEANVHVEDPGAFTMPWNAIQRYRRFEAVAAKNVSSLVQLATPEEGPVPRIRTPLWACRIARCHRRPRRTFDAGFGYRCHHARGFAVQKGT